MSRVCLSAFYVPSALGPRLTLNFDAIFFQVWKYSIVVASCKKWQQGNTMARKILFLRKTHLFLLILVFGAMTIFSGELSVALRQYVIYAPNFSEKLSISYNSSAEKKIARNFTFKLEHCPCNRTIMESGDNMLLPKKRVEYHVTTCGRDAFQRWCCNISPGPILYLVLQTLTTSIPNTI